MLAVKCILPTGNGYIIRSDFLRYRLVGCDLADSYMEFVTPGQRVSKASRTNDDAKGLFNLLDNTVGVVISKAGSKETVQSQASALNDELLKRLSFPWVVSTPLTRKRLAIVGSRHRLVMAAWFESAYHLGIEITLIGAPGHFLEDQVGRYPAVENYIAIDMTIDDELSLRIATALRGDGREFHGITTFKDPYLTHVARTAVLLHLPTAPLDAINTCIDKHLTRLFAQGPLDPLRVVSLADFQEKWKSTVLRYPLIVKPCSGYGSEGVFKAENETELIDTIRRLESASEKPDIMIDAYIDGPEVDANFAMLNGEVLFYELVDGFPCTAEDESVRGGNFLETDQMWPSNHPPEESDLLRKELSSLLLKLGFRNGIFHVEARIRFSAMHYSVEDGIQDLRPHGRSQELKPTYFLLEINQRPPGHGGFSATKYTYGIDYLALYSLCALGEKERVVALSQPFHMPGGAQYWCDSVFINAERPGIYNGGDIPQKVRELCPNLMEEVIFSACYYQNGDVVSDDPPRIALFVVASKVSRSYVRNIAQKIRVQAQRFVSIQ